MAIPMFAGVNLRQLGWLGSLLMAVIAGPAMAEPLNPERVPDLLPAHVRFALTDLRQQPAGWSSLTSWGEAVTTEAAEGFVDMKNWRMTCLIDGQRKTVINGLNDIGGGFYKLNPWYEGDLQTLFQIQSLSDAIRIPVRPKTISHWWLNRRPSVTGASNCEVTAEIQMSPGVYVSIGGDYWVNPSVPYAGDKVNNHFMGRSAWHDSVGGYQTITFR